MANIKRCAYLTMEKPDGFEVDIELAFPPLAEKGWQFDAVSWRSAEARWRDYDAVYIGAAWDYPQDPEHFVEVLDSIDRSGALLVNDISLVRWTLAKTYLRDLELRGADIVPSLWHESFDTRFIDAAFDYFGSERIIIKPVVSTNAMHTYLLSRDDATVMSAKLQSAFGNRPFVIQEFIASVQGEGEFSLFFFAGDYSHAVRKVPAEADFRVQEMFGAEIIECDPGQDLLDAGWKIIGMVQPVPVYARIDLVRRDNGNPLLMELELIEPSLYLRQSPQAPKRFADAFDRNFRIKIGGGA